jgi:uncharacterized membrane-anchored protein
MKNKVPVVTFAFWLIKIAATTLGETGGDAVSMSLELGYAISTAIFAAFFLLTVSAQIASSKLHRFLYWSVIVATTTVGTTTSDYLTRTAGLGYLWTSLILFASVLIVLGLWYYTRGSIDVNHVHNRKAEAFYWLTILTSNTLGTALGDCLADTSGLGYVGGALLIGALLAVLAALYFFTDLSHVLIFWAAFILTRPLGATLGDALTKPLSEGGLNLSRFSSSLVLAVFMIIAIIVTSAKKTVRPEPD